MKAHGSSAGFDVSHTVQSYPWAKLGTATVVDVRTATRPMDPEAGGKGHLLRLHEEEKVLANCREKKSDGR
jgi:hypothetical protein